jgi:phenylalanyl-tRNA synthetase beta chain
MLSPEGHVALTTGGGDVLWNVATADGRVLGRVQRVALDAPPWAAPAFGAELVLGVMPNDFVAPPGQHARRAGAERPPRLAVRAYRGLPTTPAAQFDLALLVPSEMRAEVVEQVMRVSGGELLEQLALFDEYRGEGVPAGYRSVAWTLTFRDPVRTLRDKEIEGRRQKILKSLENELGVRPRAERSS